MRALAELYGEWVRWVPLVWVALAFVVNAVLARLLLAGAIRRARLLAHWTERAAAAHAVRTGALRVATLANFPLIAVSVALLRPGSAVPLAVLVTLVMFASAAGAVLATHRPPIEPPGAPLYRLTVGVLLASPTLLVLFACFPLMGLEGAAAAIGTVVLAALAWALARGGNVALLVRLGLARPDAELLPPAAPPGMRALRLPTPVVFAGALPGGHLVLTDGALAALHADERHAIGVAASHAPAGPRIPTAWLGVLLLGAAREVAVAAGFGASLPLFVLACAAFGAELFGTLRWSRATTVHVDAVMATDPIHRAAYARALERLQERALVPARQWGGLPLDERLAALGAPPAWKAPPPRRLPLRILLAPLLAGAATLAVPIVPVALAPEPLRWPLSVALGRADAEEIGATAITRDPVNHADARALLAVAAELDPEGWAPASVNAYVAAGDCARARAAATRTHDPRLQAELAALVAGCRDFE